MSIPLGLHYTFYILYSVHAMLVKRFLSLERLCSKFFLRFQD